MQGLICIDLIRPNHGHGRDCDDDDDVDDGVHGDVDIHVDVVGDDVKYSTEVIIALSHPAPPWLMHISTHNEELAPSLFNLVVVG